MESSRLNIRLNDIEIPSNASLLNDNELSQNHFRYSVITKSQIFSSLLSGNKVNTNKNKLNIYFHGCLCVCSVNYHTYLFTFITRSFTVLPILIYCNIKYI